MQPSIITKLTDRIDQNLSSLVVELQDLGVSHVGHGLILDGKIPTAYFSAPEWADRYEAEDLVSRDPIRACALKENYHIIPWDCIPATKKQKVVLEERKRVFQARSGILISIKHPSFHETFAIGCSSKKYDIFHLLNKDKNSILSYLLKFRAEHLSYYR